MKRPLKLCPGDHDTGAACAVCDEDNTVCDVCWEKGYPDECRTVAVPERIIEVWDDYTERSTTYVVCMDHYREHRRRVESESE